MTNGHYVIPKLVEDASLKRARTEVEIDGEKKDVIRVLPAGGAGLDAQGVADGMALAPSNSATSDSAIGVALRINSTVNGISSKIGSAAESAWEGSGAGPLIAVEKRTALAAGAPTDSAWSGSGNATIIALLKGIYNKL